MTRHEATGGSRGLPLRAFVNGLAGVLVLATLAMALLTRLVPLAGWATYVVAGPSMAPGLPVGSAVIVQPVEPSALAVGDVVTIKSGPSRAIFTHRIVRLIQRDGALWVETKGDANAAPDPTILPATDVLGRVTVAVPYVGYLVALGTHPSGMVLLVAVGLLLLAIGWILDPKRTIDPAAQPA